MDSSPVIPNFGRNLTVQPRFCFHPQTEAELLNILDDHRHHRIRVMGSRHAWSAGIQTDDVLLDLKHFQQIQIVQDAGLVNVGAGCQIKTLLAALTQRQLTLPSVGLIAKQTIAGAIATGTHGSGKHSLSHYVQSIRVAYFDPLTDQAQIVEITHGDELRAARCSLGCLGVIVAVTLPCIPQYFIEEKATPCSRIEDAIAREPTSPLQQFFLIPHSWNYVVQERRVSPEQKPQGGAFWYRLYWLLCFDLGLHLLIITFAAKLRSRRCIQGLYGQILPRLIAPNWIVCDRSDRQLIMNHDLFRHFEMEVFVLRSHLIDAATFLTEILQLADNAQHALSATTLAQIQSVGLEPDFPKIAGCFTHHYPICFRRILPDDTLISMAAGQGEDWYSISLITYVMPRDTFQTLARFIAVSFSRLFHARLHWGKWFPLSAGEIAPNYPEMEQFQQICQHVDPQGQFRNAWLTQVFGLPASSLSEHS